MKKNQRVYWEIWGPDLSPSQIRPSCGAKRERSGSKSQMSGVERWAGFKKFKWSVSGAEREVVGAGAERWAGLS